MKYLLLSFILLGASLPLFSASRIFFNVENSGLLPYIYNTAVQQYLPDAKCVYWQFFDEWVFSTHPGKSQIILDIDNADFGRANVWSYAFNKANQYVQFNIIADDANVYPYYMMQSYVNYPYGSTGVEFLDTKPLPEEIDWKTAKQFCSLLVQSTDFLSTYDNRSSAAKVVFTLGYSANTFAEQELDKLYWSAAVIDNGFLHYCYADAYTLDEIYCYNTGIKEEVLATTKLHPNPSSDNTTITLDLQQSSHLNITLMDVFGREIKQIYNALTDAGIFTQSFTTNALSKGVYYLRIQIGGDVKIEKVVVN